MIQNPPGLDQAAAPEPGVARGDTWLLRICSRDGFVLAAGVLLATGYLAGFGKTWGNLALACMLAGVTQNLRRGLFVIASLGLFFVAFPPFAVPLCYVVCCAPLFYLWRYEPKAGLQGRFEAWMIGFAAAWIAAPFLAGAAGANGRWLMVMACGIFGIQWLLIAESIRRTRSLSPGGSALIAALVAACLELARTNLLDFPVLLLGLPAAATPLAQWARFLSLFGVSAIIYFVSFLLVPNVRAASPLRWLTSAGAVAVFAAAWIGGTIIAANTPVPPIPFCAILVQPHGRSEVAVNGEAGGLENAHTADRLTTEALAAGPRPDLIIWPEMVLARSNADLSPLETPRVVDNVDRIDLDVFRRRLMPRYGCQCLVGASIVAEDGKTYNSACLLGIDQSIQRHDKLKLIVLAETLQTWLPAWVKESLRAYFAVKAPYSPGESFHPLLLQLPGRDPIRLAISLCYEMHFPGMPQYRQAAADVVIHMTDESWFRGFEGHPQHGTWACQYRAIETRRWQLVCANWANSAVIDPAGRIRLSLSSSEGYLNTAEADYGR